MMEFFIIQHSRYCFHRTFSVRGHQRGGGLGFGVVGNKSYLCDSKGGQRANWYGRIDIETTCVEQMRNSSIYYSSEIIGLM